MAEHYTTELGGSHRHGGGVVFRSVAVRRHSTPDVAAEQANGGSISDTADDEEYHDVIQLPQSTHCLLFTEPVLSLPFAFAIFVYAGSMLCLILALMDNLSDNTEDNKLNVPANVSAPVRMAQFLSVIIALAMEDEIPTATYLLRMVPKSSVEGKLGASYVKFVLSACVRLSVGYAFLVNVFLVIVQSDRVLDMFYDMLALQFVSMIDDIAFQLMKYAIVGKRLRQAANKKCFRTELERRPYPFRKKMTIFTKFVYVFNFIFFVSGLMIIASMQNRGLFQCNSITVTFGEQIWKRAYVETPDGSEYSDRLLIYSYFNGVYRQNGTHARRPIYRELRKSEDEHFEDKEGAVIKYCEEEEAWVFTHPHIFKSKSDIGSKCQWLLRSPKTDAYDLSHVTGPWSIWTGRIDPNDQLSVTCNKCHDSADCNLNGQCRGDGKCECDKQAGYQGMHCELEKPCPRLIGKIYNETWDPIFNAACEFEQLYGRPVYMISGIAVDVMTNNTVTNLTKDDVVHLVYTGSRWIGVKILGGMNVDVESILERAREYHAFWELSFSNEALFVSDPTKGSDPVGVDLYTIGNETGGGPFGQVLWPITTPPGRGTLYCDYSAENDSGISFVFTHCYKNSSRT